MASSQSRSMPPRLVSLPHRTTLTSPTATTVLPAKSASTTTNRMPPARKATGKAADVYIRCTGCQHEFKETTLQKNNGVCGKCVNKKPGQSSSRNARGECPDCHKEFTTATLKKHEGGRCGRCAQKSIVLIDETSLECSRCSKDVNIKTHQQYSGFCHPCVIAIMKEQFGSNFTKISNQPQKKSNGKAEQIEQEEQEEQVD